MDNPNVAGIPMTFFKWSPMFSLEDESLVVPIWVSLEKLPIFLFHKEALYEIGKLLGNPVKIDGYTANRSKLCQENLCIELDVSKPLPNHLWLKTMDKGFAVKVSYSKVPHYCVNCHKLGHLEANCLAKEKSLDRVDVVNAGTSKEKQPSRRNNRAAPDHGYGNITQWVKVPGRRGYGGRNSRGGRFGSVRGRGGGGRGDFSQFHYNPSYSKEGLEDHALKETNDLGLATSTQNGFSVL